MTPDLRHLRSFVAIAEAGSIGAAWRGNFSGTLAQLGSRGDASGQLSAAGLQMLQVGGSLRGMTVLIGADLGADAALGGSGSLVQSLAGSVAATLFDGGRTESRIALQKAVQEQTLVSYEKSVLSALEDVENALSAYATGHERVTARQTAASSIRRALQRIKKPALTRQEHTRKKPLARLSCRYLSTVSDTSECLKTSALASLS